MPPSDRDSVADASEVSDLPAVALRADVVSERATFHSSGGSIDSRSNSVGNSSPARAKFHVSSHLRATWAGLCQCRRLMRARSSPTTCCEQTRKRSSLRSNVSSHQSFLHLIRDPVRITNKYTIRSYIYCIYIYILVQYIYGYFVNCNT